MIRSNTGVMPSMATFGYPIPRTPSNFAKMKGMADREEASANTWTTGMPPTYVGLKTSWVSKLLSETKQSLFSHVLSIDSPRPRPHSEIPGHFQRHTGWKIQFHSQCESVIWRNRTCCEWLKFPKWFDSWNEFLVGSLWHATTFSWLDCFHIVVCYIYSTYTFIVFFWLLCANTYNRQWRKGSSFVRAPTGSLSLCQTQRWTSGLESQCWFPHSIESVKKEQ